MTARESIHGKLNKLRQQSKQTGQIQLSASALTLWAEAGIHLLLAAVLAGAGRALVLGAAALPVALSLGVECFRRWRLRRTSLMDIHVRCQCILRTARELDGAIYNAIDRGEG